MNVFFLFVHFFSRVSMLLSTLAFFVFNFSSSFYGALTLKSEKRTRTSALLELWTTTANRKQQQDEAAAAAAEEDELG